MNDYQELIAEVTERSGYSGLVNHAAQLTNFAEKYLSRELRLSNQETSTTLTTDANGEVSLPSDFMSFRTVNRTNCRLYPQTLQSITDSTRRGYAIRGNTLVSNYGDTDLEVVYYASIPSLSSNSTNWLLTLDPEIYVVALLWQVARKKSEAETAVLLKQELDEMIYQLRRQDGLVRFSSKINIAGANP